MAAAVSTALLVVVLLALAGLLLRLAGRLARHR